MNGGREIPLANGRGLTLVDEADYPWAARFRWRVFTDRDGRQYARWTPGTEPRRTVFLHRALLDAPAGLQVDHVNGDGLDNRRENLRLASRSQNARNRRRQRNNRSGVPNVHWAPAVSMWRAELKLHGKRAYLAYFRDLEAAAVAVRSARLRLYGAFAPELGVGR